MNWRLDGGKEPWGCVIDRALCAIIGKSTRDHDDAARDLQPIREILTTAARARMLTRPAEKRAWGGD
jgi:hypothetical protein